MASKSPIISLQSNRNWIMLLLLVLLFISGCSTGTIKDTATKEELDILHEPSAALKQMTVKSDAMLNYSSYNAMLMNNNMFVDTSYYQQHPITRGDIVMFQTGDSRFPTDFGRIIGLPNEEVQLVKGHVYIHARKLAAFYGSEYREQKAGDGETPTSMAESVKLEQGEYFVLGDNWKRSFYDSQSVGPMKASSIKGKVLGWEGPKTAWDFKQGVIVAKEPKRVAIVRNVTANALHVRSVDEIMGIAHLEALWANVKQEEEIEALEIGDKVSFELVGEFKFQIPLQVTVTNFKRIGSVFE
ncbi:signal peptidase I [Paenibacillus sp. MMS18-CY102]|uniref:signal peptidase I n=1 Tax=Paenibacillus sp. MMS18-CY102 TaxID=2682849 RepID=UPI001365951E|nr:signal peptidase I [Paenibacillus sp. MMS18-CY102]MWC29871.1 signal peptidase I [Paenibacillus sp. MMS18-CY102]